MSLEFKYYKINDIGEVVSGGTPSTSKNEYWYGDIGWITPKDLSSYDDIYISRGERNISSEGLNNSSAKLVPKNTVLMTSRAPIGYIAIANNELSTNQGFKSLICNEKICHYKYFYYWLKLNIKYIINNSNGSTFKEISGGTFKNLELSLPSLNEQKAISSVLWTIDEKISVLKRINKNLEESIKNIFKHYFIDFIPFKDKGYPEGWLSLNLGDVVSDANTGADAIKKAPIVDYDTGIKCVRVGDMTNSRRIDEWGFANVNEENFDKYQLKKEDIIVTRTATLGLNYFITEDLDAVYNNGLIRIKINKNKALPLFIYYYLNTSDYNHYIDCIEGESSTRPNMKINYLLKYPIICPPLKIQKEFIDLIDSLFWMKENIFYQIVELTRLRDTLLPKLMSGEIDVSKINCDLELKYNYMKYLFNQIHTPIQIRCVKIN